MSNALFKYALREAQSKAKQKEFGISKDEYPHFITDSDDLDYQCVFNIADYARHLLEGDITDQLQEDIKLSATYFEAALNYDEKQQYSCEYLLLGACSFFFTRNFGNAAALINIAIKKPVIYSCEKRLAYLLAYLLSTDIGVLEFETDKYYRLVDSYISKGDCSELTAMCKKADDESVKYGLQLDSLFNVITRGIITMSANFLTLKLLPQYANVSYEELTHYLRTEKIPAMLWPSQIEIGKFGGYAGNNLIIQAPTGTGKTKSIEFIIAAAFARDEAKNVVIVAPLRSLCEEIVSSMNSAFNNVCINSLTDVLQDNDFKFEDEHNILVLTPEKLEYIIFHNSEIQNSIDMFVFDEGHMIDDNHRGASFELLLTRIRNKVEYKQMVFISAVIPNGDQLGQWLYKGHEYKILSQNNIPSTSKHIAVLDDNKKLDFYSLNDFHTADYYVANSIKEKNIPTKTGKKSVHNFPENRIDAALYYANLLIPNGSLAIYFGTKKQINSCLKRIIDLTERKFEFSSIFKSIQEEQVRKLLNLIEIHYGKGNYYKCAKKGFLVHYADLEEGLKKTAEVYLRRQYANLILCTSTLSEGVNLPIKYLLMTETSNYTYDVTTRKLINLIGRAARSGHYTEGSIIVTEEIKNPAEIETKFSDKHSENCLSCFCDMVNQEYEFVIRGENIAKINIYQHIIEAIQKGDYFLFNYQEGTKNRLKNHNFEEKEWAKSKLIIDFDNLIAKCRSSLEAILIFIQNIIYSYSDMEKEDLRLILQSEIEETYGYFLMSNEEKERFLALINDLYDAVFNESIEILNKYKYIPTCRIDEIEKIIQWSDENLYLLDTDEELFINSLAKLYYDNNLVHNIDNDKFIKIIHKWSSGCTFINISTQMNVDITVVEQVCRKTISYNFAMYFGHLMDLLNDDDQIEKLRLIQKRMKYGLPSDEAIRLYESGITDRFICTKIIDNQFMKEHDYNKISFLAQYPDWIGYKYKNLLSE